MSSKNTILPATILESLLALPPAAALPCGVTAPMDKAAHAFALRRQAAIHTRVVLYRFDGGEDGYGRGRDLCDKTQAAIQAGGLPFHDLCEKLNADLQLIELGRGASTTNDTARAAAFGMMAAEEDTGLLVVTAFGAEPAAYPTNLDFFARVTPDTAAVFGAFVSAARAGIPVIGEGLKALEAAHALYALRPDLCQGIFICGVPAKAVDERFTIFADDTADHTGYAGVALATLFHNQFGKSKAA